MVQSRREARARRKPTAAVPPDPRRRVAAAGPRRQVKTAEERRRDILDAALRLFAERGFNETTVSDIASEAGMATGTVYLYFPSKEDVLEGLHDRFRVQNVARIAEVAVDTMERAGAGEQVDYRETVDAILDAIAASFVEHRDLVVVCTKYRPEDYYANPREHGDHMNPASWALMEGVRLGLIHTSDPEMTAYLFDAALAFNLHTHITFGDPPDLERLMAAAKEMIHKALALPRDAAVPPKPRSKRPRSPADPGRKARQR